ncbi:hypothetical protein BG015_001900 [Linnemannia schmuckeri]|uniref:Galactose oxidase n=1 Tax=Linnemannia schmuckeri TaxID=64567 RepID=A0A9P5S445_9FUNG|nr:hypothetical protein BG015_001900 [Linnemannia schmuckeri]
MRVPFHLPRQLRTVAWVWGTLSLLAPMVSAQAPALVCCMAYTTINENTFYIQGGLLITGPGTSSSNTSQFYALDLTQPTWNTLNPPWKPLTYPATLVALSSTSGHSMSVAQDNSGFTMWMASNLVATYTIASNSWGQIVPTPPATLFKGSNLQAATDPTTGLVYIPGAAGTPNSMSVYSSSTGMALSVPMPPTLIAAGSFYSFVWSQVRKTFIYFGGNAATPNPFFEFSPSAGKWTSMPITGSVTPPFQMRSCMVAAYNGTKILLFGGNTDTTQSVDTLYILDVQSMTWSQADNSLDARSDMACSVSGDNFIVWGGYKRFPGNPFLPASTTPLIYNIHLGKWTTTYTRGSNPPVPGKPNPSPTGKGDSNNQGGGGDSGGGGSNGAAIGGAVAGVVVVIAAIAFFVVRRRRQRPTHQPVDTKDPETTARHDPVLSSTGNNRNEPGHKNEHHQMQSSEYYQDPHNSPQYRQDPHSAQHYHDPHSAQYSSLNEPQSYPSPLQQSYSSSLQQSHPSSPQTATYYPPPPPLNPPPPNMYSPIVSKDAQDHIRQLEDQIALSEKQLAANQYNKSSNNPQYNPGYSEMQPMSPVRGPQGAGVPVTTEPTSAADHRELARKIEIMHAELQNLQSQLKL